MYNKGRGKDYTWKRKLGETALGFLYWGNWAGKLGYYTGFQRRIGISRYDVELNCNLEPLPSLKIAFAADFHASPVTHPKLLENACYQLRDTHPDVLLLGGDFVTLKARYIDALMDQLDIIEAPSGKYAVLGNHDLWAEDTYIEHQFEKHGINMIINRNARLPEPFNNVWICGFDEHRTGDPDAERGFQGADGVRIVLMHSPDGLLPIQDRHFDIAFCGHTHGGQIALPGGRPIMTAFGDLTRKYNHGLYNVGNNGSSKLIVTRGVGCTGLPIRIFAAPEIVVCKISWNTSAE